MLDPSPRPSPPNDASAEFITSRGGEGEDAPTSAVGRATWRLVTTRAGIAVYWLTMFLATHLPVQTIVVQMPTTDKHLHFSAYFVLGCALPWWSSAKSRACWRRAAWLCVLVFAYAAVDEWLQIPVDRNAEWGDWLADAAGALAGVTVGSLLINWIGRESGA